MDPLNHIINADPSNISLSFLIEILNRYNNIRLFFEMNKLGITYHEYQFLFYLYYEKNAIQEDIAKIFRRNESTITRALKKLEDKDLIRREPDENNRRKNIVFLKENGIELVKKIQEVNNEWEKEALSGFSKEEKETLKKALKKIAVNSFKKDNI